MNENKIGEKIKRLGISIIVLGILVGGFLLIDTLILGISVIISSAITGLIILGLGEIIVLLQGIKDSLSKK